MDKEINNQTNDQIDNEPNHATNNQKNNEPNNGTNNQKNNKKMTYIVTGILLVTTVLLSAKSINNVMNGDIFGVKFNVGFGSENSYSIDQHKTFELTDENIVINSVSTNITVIVEDRKDIKADFFGEIKSNSEIEPELIIEKSLNDIKIYIDYHNNNLNINDEAQLEVYIPKSFSNDLKMEGVSADVEATGLKIEELYVESVSGEVEISEVEVNNKLDMKTVSGDISVTETTSNNTTINSISGEINAEGSLGEMTMNTISGDIEVFVDKLIGRNKIKTTSGEFQLDIPKGMPFGFDLKSISGDVELTEDFDILLSETKEHIKKGTSGNSTDIYLEVETVSGDIEIE